MKPVPSYTGENYDWHWKYTSFRGKNILDLGADVGSTAYWFLQQGARTVFCVEGDEAKFRQLVDNTQDDVKVLRRYLWIDSADHLASCIDSYGFDLVKVDIEGAERHLIRVPSETVKSVKEYLIETHTPQIGHDIEVFLTMLGYEVRMVLNLPVPGQQVYYAYV